MLTFRESIYRNNYFLRIHIMSFKQWEEVDWAKVENRILRIQKRIYQASKLGNKGKVVYLQNLLLKSLDAKLLAVRKVTTENKGRKTPGVDQIVYIKPEQKISLVQNLKVDGKAFPIKRVCIPKAGTKELRPLGIPVIRDRAKQALCLMALEPEWEAKFEPNSYGFRPGRSCHDAIEAIFLSLRSKTKNQNNSKYLLDADIQKCFDSIDHDYLCNKLNTAKVLKDQVRAWLEAGIMEGLTEINDITPNLKGTPQGGVISPFLSNVALHGMEESIKKWIKTKPSFNTQRGKKAKRQAISLIRYADNFVIIHPNKEIIEEAKEVIAKWLLENPKLQLNTAKTSIINTDEGFNFLGFRCITIHRNNQARTKIYPCRENQARFLLEIRNTIQRNKNASAFGLIQVLRPKILGWGNYYRYCECKETFSKLTHLIFQKIRAWVFRRDVRNGRTEIKENYFPNGREWSFDGSIHKDNWILYGKDKSTNKEAWLPHLVWIKSIKWVKVIGTASIYDENDLYWANRSKSYGN
jgi:RNA-directed DNA polymerase